MKNNFLFVFFLTFFLIVFPSNNVVAQSIADSSYFPLNLGDEWTFETQKLSPHTEKIIDTSTINGKLYFGLTTFPAFPDFVNFWLRSSNDSIFVNMALSNDSTEYLLYNFGGNVGDTVQLPPDFGCSLGIQVVLMSKQDTVTTPAGIFTNCFHFYHIPHCMDAGIVESWFASGVGRIKYSEMSIGGQRTYILSSYNLRTDVNYAQVKDNKDLPNLLESYPNPFNTQTNLSYHVREASQVTLTIVDFLGRHIGCLVSGYTPAGDYQVSWNATGFPDGVYFAVFRGNEIFETKKLILQQ